MNLHTIKRLLERMLHEGATPIDWPQFHAVRAEVEAAIEADRQRKYADPTTRTNLHTLTLDQLRELAMRDCSKYSYDDLAIAWELFDRLVEGGRIIEADCQQRDEVWKQAVDHELSVMHSTTNSYDTPAEAIKALIDWHVAVATDPVFHQYAEPVKGPSDLDLFRTLLAERDALRDALKTMVEMVEMNGFGRAYAMDVARAAIDHARRAREGE